MNTDITTERDNTDSFHSNLTHDAADEGQFGYFAAADEDDDEEEEEASDDDEDEDEDSDDDQSEEGKSYS